MEFCGKAYKMEGGSLGEEIGSVYRNDTEGLADFTAALIDGTFYPVVGECKNLESLSHVHRVAQISSMYYAISNISVSLVSIATNTGSQSNKKREKQEFWNIRKTQ